MDTPIVDFVKKYAESNALRLHMPGHKGRGNTFERLDVTEFDGADSLFEANGIIRESEKNASAIFGANTFYSTEGSSIPIKAMLYLVKQYAVKKGIKPFILAGRNAHKSFLSGVALLDIDVDFIYPEKGESYLSCNLSPFALESYLDSQNVKPVAVYITTPDYLGNNVDVKGLADVCKKYSVFLLVDNAHGAYLKFLHSSMHPIDLGATMCCDSAHKTLPCITGSAYLHVNRQAPSDFITNAKTALSFFASTSPSYLILQSLDELNATLSDGYFDKINQTLSLVNGLKDYLTKKGWTLYGNEPLKVTLDAKTYGYTGNNLAELLAKNRLICEFHDTDYLVMMFSTSLNQQDFDTIKQVFELIPKKEKIKKNPPLLSVCERVYSISDAIMMPNETLDVDDCLNRVASQLTTSCPPAVPIVISGERISRLTIDAFKYYGIKKCSVIIE